MKKDPTYIDPKLLVLYLLDEISQKGRAIVEAWLYESPENRDHFESLKKTWDQTGSIDPETVAFDTPRAWEKIATRIQKDTRVTDFTPSTHEKQIHKQITGPRRITGFWIAAAAVLLLALVSVVFTRLLNNDQFSGYVVASAGTVVQDTLADGSSLILNTNSELEVTKRFASNNRTVKLRGEAFFQVKPDSVNPFIIETGAGSIRVLGTAFQVRAYPGSDLEVFVESGQVELTAGVTDGEGVKRIVLKAGERGRIPSGSSEIVRPEDIGPDELFWANRKLIFQETKLALVFDLLKIHYKATIEIKNEEIGNCLLSATFTDETISQILEVVAASFDLELILDGEKYILNGKGCTHESE